MTEHANYDPSNGDIQWRFLIEPAPAPAGADDDEEERDRVWLALQLLHTPVAVARCDPCGEHLADELREIEKIVLEHPQLSAYWMESESGGPAAGTSSSTTAAVPTELPFLMSRQARLMEQVYSTLQLDRFANAPANRGWMNLLRSWGRSPRFNAEFDRYIGRALSPEFVTFYNDYIRDWSEPMEPLKAVPVPHPWDTESRRQRGKKVLRGIYLDPGIREREVPRP